MWAWVGVALALAGTGAALLLSDPEADRISLMFIVALVAFGFLGMVIRRRSPGNIIGALFLGLAAAISVSVFAEGYTGRNPALPAAGWVALLGSAVVDTVSPLLVILPLLYFPSGRLPSSRWRPLVWGLWALTATATVGYGVQPSSGESYGSLPNPLGIAGSQSLVPWADGALSLVLIGGLVAAVASLVGRYRRSRGLERAQIRWVTFAGTLLALEILFVVAVAEVVFSEETLAETEWLGGLLFLVALMSLPLAMTVAIARYRLYDIDRIVSRTVSYGLVVALLAAVYAGAVFVLGLLLPVEGDLAVAGSTLAVAALFGPLRRRLQGGVDRRFNRSRYDAEQELGRFAERLRQKVDIESITGDLVGVVSRTVQPVTTGVWLRRGEM